MKKLILASGSPRRKELLTEAGISFEVMKSDFEENNDEQLPPHELAIKHAKGKALDVAKRITGGIVLGADTIVVLDGEVIGKPKDKNDAKNILIKLSGKKHEVITGFSLIDAKTGMNISKAVISKITFKKLTEKEIDEYLSIDEYKDKAGAYAYQGVAKKFIKKANGSKSNIIGLPMETLIKELKKFWEIT